MCAEEEAVLRDGVQSIAPNLREHFPNTIASVRVGWIALMKGSTWPITGFSPPYVVDNLPLRGEEADVHGVGTKT